MKKKLSRIPDAELDIMLILWRHDRALRVSEIYTELQPVRPCSKAAVHTLIDRLSKRGFTHIEHVETTQPYKLITPLVKEKDYRTTESQTLVDKLCSGKWQPLIASLCDCGKLSEADLDEIAELLNKGSKKK